MHCPYQPKHENNKSWDHGGWEKPYHGFITFLVTKIPTTKNPTICHEPKNREWGGIDPTYRNLRSSQKFSEIFLAHLSLRLFQHTFGTHPEQPFSNRIYRDSFHSWRTGDCLGCALGVCCNFLGLSLLQTFIYIVVFLPPSTEKYARNSSNWIMKPQKSGWTTYSPCIFDPLISTTSLQHPLFEDPGIKAIPMPWGKPSCVCSQANFFWPKNVQVKMGILLPICFGYKKPTGLKFAAPRYTLGCPPSQDSSHHQVDITFLLGDPYKPSFATVTGRGDNPRYT